MNFFEKAQARAHAIEILGLPAHPDRNEIKQAFKKLAREKHPDHGGTDEEFAQINAAYSLLKEDNGFTNADLLHPAPADTGATTFESNPRKTDNLTRKKGDAKGAKQGSYVAPRKLRTAMTSRIFNLNSSMESECRMLLDEIPSMAEPEADEVSLRANILEVIQESGAPYVPHTNHLPYAVRQSGRRISYMVKDEIVEGVNRVAVPTGAFTDNRKVLPKIIRFKAGQDGSGPHVTSAATLAESFPGAKSVRVHFGMKNWPETTVEKVKENA